MPPLHVLAAAAAAALLLAAHAAWYSPEAGNSSGLFPPFQGMDPWCNPALREDKMHTSIRVTVTVTSNGGLCACPGQCKATVGRGCTTTDGYGLRVTVNNSCNATLHPSAGPGGRNTLVFFFGQRPPWRGGNSVSTPYLDDPQVGVQQLRALCNFTVEVDCTGTDAVSAAGASDGGGNCAPPVQTAADPLTLLRVIGNCTSGVHVKCRVGNACAIVTRYDVTVNSHTRVGVDATSKQRFTLPCTIA